MKVLFILNGAPYGDERTYNGLRLAGALAKREQNDVRVFLMGDAAHLLTPMWALGLNSGVLDALNLSWRQCIRQCTTKLYFILYFFYELRFRHYYLLFKTT